MKSHNQGEESVSKTLCEGLTFEFLLFYRNLKISWRRQTSNRGEAFTLLDSVEAHPRQTRL